MKIQILIDNKDSWILYYIDSLVNKILNLGHNVNLVYSNKKVNKGDILFLLSCNRIFKQLDLNKHNIVVHESDLPQGKGFSPLTWQILEGKKTIPISLFEATSKFDSGEVYFKDSIELNGDELIDEIRNKQFIKTEFLILKFLKNINNLNVIQNHSKETFYRKRNKSDSALDIEKSIKEQFNLLRVVDNKRYPAYFINKGEKYTIKIFKKNNYER